MPRFDTRTMAAACVLTALVACSSQHQAESAASADASMQAPAPIQSVVAPMDAGGASREEADDEVQPPGVEPGQLLSTANTATDPKRRFVRTAEASFQVRDVYASTLAIEDAVAAEGGFVASNRIATRTLRERERPIGERRRLRLTEVATEGSLVVRVPSERTQAFLRAIARQMQFLDARSFEANDVQFELLRRELAHARAQALQQDIRDAAAQPGKTGAKVEAVQARAQMLASRDEALVAQRELEDRIAYSSLRLELRQPPQVRETVVPDTEAILRERGPGFFSESGAALRSGWRGLLAAVVLMLQLWPLWLAVALAAWAFVALRGWRRRQH